MSDESRTEPDQPTTNVTAFLHQQRSGGLAIEWGEALAEVTAAVIEQQKAGTVTIKISVSPTKDGSAVFVTDDVLSKVPKADRGGSIMYADREGQLSRQDPRKMKLPIRVVATVDGDPVEVDTNTGEVKEIG